MKIKVKHLRYIADEAELNGNAIYITYPHNLISIER